MSDAIDAMTGFMKNFDNKADVCLLGLVIDRRGESGFAFYRIDRKLGEALRGRIKEGYRYTRMPSGSGFSESDRRIGSLLPRNQNNHG